MRTNWKIKDFVVVAIVAVIFGLFFFAVDALYVFLSPILGSLLLNLIFGIYCLSATVPIILVRKLGAGVLGSTLAGVVNMLAGSPYGINIIVAGFLQGLGAEIGFLKAKMNIWVSLLISAFSITVLVSIRDYFVFGLNQLPIGTLILILIIRLVSAFVLGGGIAYLINIGLKKTGVLKDEPSSSKS